MKLANLHLVTGYAGREHVTAADQGAFNVALLGSGQFVMNKGNKLAASIVSNNQIRIADGDIYMQGRFIRLNEGSYADLVIENGTQGMLRNDLIVARYTKDVETGIEEVNLAVIKGVAAASNPSDPGYTSGNIIEGNAYLNDMPLYRVVINGLTVESVVKLFSVKEKLIPTAYGDINAAPAGFGLGEASGRSVVDPKEAIKPGFYCPSGDTAVDMPAGGYSLRYGTLLAERRGNAVELTLRYQNSTAKGYGTLTNGVLSSVVWEWENPPMQLGVEYRTTERHLGKPVYAKVVSFTPTERIEPDTLFSIPHGVNSIGNIVRWSGRANAYSMPFSGHNGSFTGLSHWGNETLVMATTGTGWGTNYTFYIALFYTKTTD